MSSDGPQAKFRTSPRNPSSLWLFLRRDPVPAFSAFIGKFRKTCFNGRKTVVRVLHPPRVRLSPRVLGCETPRCLWCRIRLLLRPLFHLTVPTGLNALRLRPHHLWCAWLVLYGMSYNTGPTWPNWLFLVLWLPTRKTGATALPEMRRILKFFDATNDLVPDDDPDDQSVVSPEDPVTSLSSVSVLSCRGL